MYSQFGEDRWILKNLELPDKGTFVDVGAGDGISLSNTFAFEHRGWRGLCVEPDPRSFSKLRQNRQCSICNWAVGTPGSGQFHLRRQPHLSGFDRGGRAIRVHIATLDEILARYYKMDLIDLMSIDVEGRELDVWATLSIKPSILIIEFLTAGLRSHFSEIKGRLISDGYRIQHVTAANIIASLIH